MRLVRSVQVALGLAATGGVVALLSGSALAADGSLGTTSQPPALNTQPTPVNPATLSNFGSGSHPALAKDSESKNGLPQSKQTAVGAEPTGATDAGGSIGLGNGSDNAKTAQLGTDLTKRPPVLSGQSEPPAVGIKPVAGEPHPAVLGEAVAPGVDQRAVEPQRTNPILPVAQKPDAPEVVTITTPVIGSTVDESAVAHATVLIIQPVITNRVASLVSDLAAMVPSAPAPAKIPAPTQSSGLLGNLTAQLAGTVVPQPLTSYGTLAMYLSQTLPLMTLTVLLLNVFTFTYGLWLRRGGFVTAARSDSPASSSSSVATPFSLGYALLPLQLHNPSFNGGRNEKVRTVSLIVRNAFRKEETS